MDTQNRAHKFPEKQATCYGGTRPGWGQDGARMEPESLASDPRRVELACSVPNYCTEQGNYNRYFILKEKKKQAYAITLRSVLLKSSPILHELMCLLNQTSKENEEKKSGAVICKNQNFQH